MRTYIATKITVYLLNSPLAKLLGTHNRGEEEKTIDRTTMTERYSDRDKEKFQDNCCRVQFIKVLKLGHIYVYTFLFDKNKREREK